MREPGFDQLRTEVGDAVRQPDFASVRGRARRVRRRRALTSGAMFLATVLAVTGVAQAVRTVLDDGAAVSARPAAAGPLEYVWPRMTSTAAAGTALYGALARCTSCDAEFYTSPDDGATWQRRTVPPGPQHTGDPRRPVLIPLNPDTVAWYEPPFDEPSTPGPATLDRLWITSDDGRSWRPAVRDMRPVDAVPPGAKPVDCRFLLRVSTCAVAVLDPATGRLAPLSGQPTGIEVGARWTDDVNVPPDGRLWVPGLEPGTRKPAVAVSSDAGRTWRTHAFARSEVAVTDIAMHRPQVAAGPGTTAYVLAQRAGDLVDTYYTTDGGATWRTGEMIPGAWLVQGFVTVDGLHVVSTYTGMAGTNTGMVGGRGDSRYTPVSLPGYPEAPLPPVQVAAARYLVTSEIGPYLSEDGRTWRQVRLP